MVKEYKRICPDCGEAINYSTYKVFWKARTHNSTCRPCFYQSRVGHKVSKITRSKIGEANSISLIGNIPWNKGKPTSNEVKKKLSVSHIGLKHGESTRKKHRKRIMERLIKYGIPTNRDVGAKEFFDELNKTKQSNFQPKRFTEIGYEADGYDADHHVWIEFDTPYHFYVTGELKPSDIKRQQRIIKYFESTKNPLKEFIRVKANGDGDVIEMKTIYTGKQ